jgi:Fur family ferric uptake transcriptional regulator
VRPARSVPQTGRAARSTRQRRAIRRVLEASGRPLSPREILAGAHRLAPTLGVATVYRTVRTFLDDGLLVRVELPGESVRYERAGKQHHHHFHCRGCDRLFEIEGCRAMVRPRAPKGFVVEDHELVFYGRCAACAE